MRIRRGFVAVTLALATLAIPTAASAAPPADDGCRGAGPWMLMPEAVWITHAGIFGFTGPSPDDTGNNDGFICGHEKFLGTARFLTSARDNETVV